VGSLAVALRTRPSRRGGDASIGPIEAADAIRRPARGRGAAGRARWRESAVPVRHPRQYRCARGGRDCGAPRPGAVVQIWVLDDVVDYGGAPGDRRTRNRRSSSHYQ